MNSESTNENQNKEIYNMNKAHIIISKYSGIPLYHTIRESEDICKADFVNSKFSNFFYSEENWNELVKEGYEIKKCEIKIL